jgi:hypothetical protein
MMQQSFSTMFVLALTLQKNDQYGQTEVAELGE